MQQFFYITIGQEFMRKVSPPGGAPVPLARVVIGIARFCWRVEPDDAFPESVAPHARGGFGLVEIAVLVAFGEVDESPGLGILRQDLEQVCGAAANDGAPIVAEGGQIDFFQKDLTAGRSIHSA